MELKLRCHLGWGHVIFGPVLLLRAVSGSVVLPQPRCVMMSIACVTTVTHTEGCVDA